MRELPKDGDGFFATITEIGATSMRHCTPAAGAGLSIAA
jgi:hypothetical protein